jgi:hypothetical protein
LRPTVNSFSFRAIAISAARSPPSLSRSMMAGWPGCKSSENSRILALK